MEIEFTELAIKNFRAFGNNEENVILFPKNSKINLCIAENGLGKTSIFQALLWVLYGQVKHAHGQVLTPDMLFNVGILKHNDISLMIKLKFDHIDDEQKKEEWILTRSMSMVGPIKDKKLITQDQINNSLYLQIDGKTINTTEVQNYVNNVLSTDTAQFSIINSHKMNTYKDFAKKTGDSDEGLIHKEIEKLLGLPLIQNATKIIAETEKTLSDDIKKIQGTSKKYNEAKKEIENLEIYIGSFEEQRLNWNEKKEEANEIIGEIDEWMEGHKLLSGKNQTIKDLKIELKVENDAHDDSKTKLNSYFSSLWKFPFKDFIEPIKNNLEESKNKTIERFRESQLYEMKKESLKNNFCNCCNIELNDKTKNEIQKYLDENKNTNEEIKSLQKINEENLEIETNIKELNENSLKTTITKQTMLDQFKESEKKYINITGLKQKIKSQEEELYTTNKDFTGRENEKIETRTKELIKSQEYSEKIEEIDGKIVEFEKQIQSENEIVTKNSSDDEHSKFLDNLQKTIKDLELIYSKSKFTAEQFLVKSVEKSATTYFMDITHKTEEFKGIEINEDYNIKILTKLGPENPDDSTGESTVVAISLILALNNNAIKKIPIVLDNTFEDLDNSHKSKLLHKLAEIPHQVTIFAHDGVLSDRDLNSEELTEWTQNSLGKLYSITRDPDTLSSKITLKKS